MDRRLHRRTVRRLCIERGRSSNFGKGKGGVADAKYCGRIARTASSGRVPSTAKACGCRFQTFQRSTTLRRRPTLKYNA